jgi:hypothetical protein
MLDVERCRLMSRTFLVAMENEHTYTSKQVNIQKHT